MKLFDQQFNVFDSQIEMEGVQEFLSRLSGVIRKDDNRNTIPETLRSTKYMTLFGNFKFFGQDWVSESRTIKHDGSQSQFPSTLGKYHTWKQIAQTLNDGFKFDTKKVNNLVTS